MGIGIGLLICVPRLGVLQSADIRKVNFLPILFVGGVLSMSRVLVESNALDVLTDLMSRGLGPLFSNLYGSYSGSLLERFPLSSFVGEFAVHAEHFHARRDPVFGGARPESGGDWDGVDFRFLGPDLRISVGGADPGYSYGYFEPKDLFKIGGALAIVEFLILLVGVTFYWPLIGMV